MTAFDSLLLSFGPSVYLPLQETTGTVASDISGNGLNGTYAGTKTLASSALVSGDPANVLFPDSSGSVTVPFDPQLQAGAFTVGCMVSFTSTAPGSRNVINARASSVGYNLELQGTAPGLQIGNGAFTGGAISANTTYLLVATFDGYTGTAWLNALQISGQTYELNQTLVPSISTSASFVVNPNAATIGKVFFIPNRALTPLEIHQLYEYSIGSTSYSIGSLPAVPRFYLDQNNVGGTASDGQSLWEAESNPAKPFATMDGIAKVAPRDSIVYVRQANYPVWAPNYGDYNNIRERSSSACGVVGQSNQGVRGGGFITFMPYPGENPQIADIQPQRFRHLRFQGFQNMVASNTNLLGFCTQAGCHHIEYVGCQITNPVSCSTTTEVERLTLGGATSGTYQLQYWTQPFPRGVQGAPSVQGTTATINFNDTAATIQSKLQALAAIGSGNITVAVHSGGTDGAGPYDITWAGSLAGQTAGVSTTNGGFIIGNSSDNDGQATALAITNSTLAGGTGASVSQITAGGYTVVSSTAINLANSNVNNHHHRVERCVLNATQGNAIQASGAGNDWLHDIAVLDNVIGANTGTRCLFHGNTDNAVFARNKIKGAGSNPVTTHCDWYQLSGAARFTWLVANEVYGPEFLAQYTGFSGGLLYQGFVFNNLLYNNEGPGQQEYVWTTGGHGTQVSLFEGFNTVAGRTQGASLQGNVENYHFCNYFQRWAHLDTAITLDKRNVVGIADGSVYDATDIVGTSSPGGLDWNDLPISNPTLTNNTTGSTTASYRLVAVDAQGKRALAGNAVTTTTANATPNTTINWNTRSGATSYDVLKQVGAAWQKLGSTSGTSLVDTGQATSAYALPTVMEGQPQFVAPAAHPASSNPGASGSGNYMPLPTDNIYKTGVQISGLAIPGYGWANLKFSGSVPTTDIYGTARNTTTPCIGAVEAA